jgi:putative ABC transport system substrate-binding protein
MDPLSRRQFAQGMSVASLALAAGCGRLPWQAESQAKVPRIGWLSDAPAASESAYRDALRQGLRDLGYVDGQNIVLETRWAEPTTDASFPGLAAELVGLPVDVIVSSDPIPTLAASRASTTIPIVMATGGDPVRLGIAAGLARPGGNVTGLSTQSPALSAKRLELLRDAVPTISRVGIVTESTNPSGVDQLRETQAAAHTLGLQAITLDVRGPTGLDGAFGTAAQEQIDALCLLAVNLGVAERGRLVEFAAENRLPAMYFRREIVEGGGLMGYGPNLVAMVAHSATHVHKLLKGASPAELPIEQVATFDLVINLKTAQALGLTIPQHVLLQATEVLQ